MIYRNVLPENVADEQHYVLERIFPKLWSLRWCQIFKLSSVNSTMWTRCAVFSKSK